jgi:hypothetical protein
MSGINFKKDYYLINLNTLKLREVNGLYYSIECNNKNNHVIYEKNDFNSKNIENILKLELINNFFNPNFTTEDIKNELENWIKNELINDSSIVDSINYNLNNPTDEELKKYQNQVDKLDKYKIENKSNFC